MSTEHWASGNSFGNWPTHP